MKLPFALATALLFSFALPAAAAPPELLPRKGDFIAMAGDSITWQSRYSLWVEMYLLAARPDLDLRVMKIQRWCGGTADNYAAETLEQELLPARPNIATVCFGMNDGGGREPDPRTADRYAAALTRIVERGRAAGTVTVVCSPGVVDPFSYDNPELAGRLSKAAGAAPPGPAAARAMAADAYNHTLAGLGDAGRRVAEARHVPFADVHAAMEAVLREARSGYGSAWPPRVSLRHPDRPALLCDDGIHPDTAAHIPMACAVLKAMGFDGDIGHIDLDWAAGAARTDPAQTAAVTARGRVEVQSRRLPLCFFDDSACSEGYPSVPCRYVLRYCPFESELNRYVLRVSGLPNQPVRVTWGGRGLVFTREQLEAGINLAAEFPDNPFCPAMRALDAAVWRKQVYERSLFAILNVPVWDEHFAGSKPEVRRELLRQNLDEFSKWAAGEFAADPKTLDACREACALAREDPARLTPDRLSALRKALFERDREYHEKARASVEPVRHVIVVEPVP